MDTLLEIEQLEPLEKIPPEVIAFILSEETSGRIAEICEKNGVMEDEKIEEITKRIVWVALDKLPSGNLATALELWVKLTPETARKVADEANQFISSTTIQFKPEKITQPEKELPKETMVEEKLKRSSSKDAYREKIE